MTNLAAITTRIGDDGDPISVQDGLPLSGTRKAD